MISNIFKTALIYSFILFSSVFGDNKNNIISLNKTETINIATEEYPPYSSQYIKDYGINSRVIKEAFALVNVKVNFEFFPGARAFKMAKSGKFDATMPWAKREGREKYFHYSEPLIQSDTEHFFYLKDNPISWDVNLQNYKQLSGTVGVIIGYNYGDSFNKAVKNGDIYIEKVSKLNQNFKMLFKGRVQSVICQKRVCEYILQTEFYKIHRDLLTSKPQNKNQIEYDYMLFSKKSKKSKRFKALFKKGMDMLKKNGSYHKIVVEDFNNGYYEKIKE